MRAYQNPETLKKLYLDEKISLKQIVRKLNVPYSTLHYWMVKYSIPRRIDRIPIPKEILSELYLKKKLSLTQIANLYKCGVETIRMKLIKFDVPRRTISESITKFPKTSFSGDLVEKSYMLGLRTGDLFAYRDSKLIRVTLSTTHKLMIELIRKIFGKYGYIRVVESAKSKGKYIHIFLDSSFEFLLEKLKSIPTWVIQDDKLFYAFLAGYIDADGCWAIKSSSSRKRTEVACFIITEDEIILKQIKEKLIQLGFMAHFYKSYEKGELSSVGTKYSNDVYTVCLVRKNEVVKLAKILKGCSKHLEKQLKIDLILSHHDKDWYIVKPKLDQLRSFIKQNVFN